MRAPATAFGILAVLAVLAVGSPARADSAGYGEYRQPVVDDDFWREVVEPHAEEVATVLGKISQALDLVTSLNMQDTDADASQRSRLLDEARGMARYLRRLAPANTEVLLALGRVADEAGRSDEALEALHAYLDHDPAGGEAAFRVGRIYLRLRKYDEAVRYLRIAAASGAAYMTNATIYLATALADTGRDDEAMDVLSAAVERPGQWGSEPQLPSFALAVAYDRDEQINEAFETIDRLQTNMQGGYASEMQRLIDTLQLVPASETHYYRALLYESSGYLDEARASWLLYAAAGNDARFRGRALQHVAAIDVLIEKSIAARKPARRTAVTRGGGTSRPRPGDPAAATQTERDAVTEPRRVIRSRTSIAGAVLVALGAASGASAADETVWDRATAEVDAEAARFTYRRQLESGNEDVQLAASEGSSAKRRHVMRALTAYRNAIAAMPDEAEAHYRLGITEYTYFMVCERHSPTPMCAPDNPDPAVMRDIVDHWHRFTELAPLDVRATGLLFPRAILHTKLATKADLLLAIEDYEAVLHRHDNATAIDDVDLDGVLSNLAETYMMVGRLDEAIETYERAAGMSGDTATTYGLAVALDRDGQGTRARQLIANLKLTAYEEFRDRIAKGQTFFVPDGEVFYYHALIEEALGMPQQAIAFWNLYLRSGAHPEFQPRARHNRDVLAAKLKRGTK